MHAPAASAPHRRSRRARGRTSTVHIDMGAKLGIFQCGRRPSRAVRTAPPRARPAPPSASAHGRWRRCIADNRAPSMARASTPSKQNIAAYFPCALRARRCAAPPPSAQGRAVRLFAPRLMAIERSDGPTNTPSIPSTRKNFVERVKRGAGLDHRDRLGHRIRRIEISGRVEAAQRQRHSRSPGALPRAAEI